MNRDLGNFRQNYQRDVLDISNVSSDPFQQFDEWFQQALQCEAIAEPNACTLATVDAQEQPHARVVLIKEYHAEGFVFYTNYQSQKANDIQINPKVSLSFFWPALERQVLIWGVAEKVTFEDSDAYFHSRPKGSQLGAWCSEQSAILPNRDVLETKLKALENEYKNKVVPRPPHWGGYLVKPTHIEFWQGRPNRLHDRIRYRWNNHHWFQERLSP